MKKLIVFIIAFFFIGVTHAYALPNNKLSVLIVFKSKIDHQLVNSAGGVIKGELKNFPIIIADLPKEKIIALKKNYNIDLIEEDGVWSATAQTLPWGINRVGAEVAQSQGITGKGIKVGVLDSGISTHEDLIIAGGWNFINNTSNCQDDLGHGTHVAGIISAVDNNIGVVGAAPNVQIYALKVLDNQGNANWSTIAKAIDWAITNRINVLNMSFGGNTGSKTIERVLKKANDSGILLVAAVGNQGNNAGVNYPAKYETVIAVGATDMHDKLAGFSNTGTELELVAPGVDISSTYLGNSYINLSGTSMAVPHVTGVTALIWSINPTLNNKEVRDRLKQSTIDLGIPGVDNYYGNGLIKYR